MTDAIFRSSNYVSQTGHNGDYSKYIINPKDLALFSPDGTVPVTLSDQVAAFLIYLQSDQSPEPFRNGYKQLGQLETRSIDMEHTSIILQKNPMRMRNLRDFQKDVREGRKCFLCPDNLLDGELGLAYGDDNIIFGNLFPILDGHLVIVNRSHVPQDLIPQLSTALRLADELRSHFFFYNGPEVGASAPDHRHLQGGLRNAFRIEQDLLELESGRPKDKLIVDISTKVHAFIPTTIDRSVLVVRGHTQKDVEDGTTKAVNRLKKCLSNYGLLDFNFAVSAQGNELTSLIFPRKRFRMKDFFKPSSLKISPATIELVGLWVVPVEGDYERVTADDIKEILGEISFSPAFIAKQLSANVPTI
jgi:hypothetical protein